MREDEKIINIFKEKKKSLKTVDILKELYPKEYDSIQDDVYADDEKNKRTKARLHRKTLYHINKLVKEGILEVSGIGNKGKKSFSLIEEDIIITNKKRTIISNPSLPAMPTEGYEERNLMKKYEKNTWISRINSSLLQCKNILDVNSLREIIEELLSLVNDCIGANDFETIIEKSSEEQLIDFLKKTDQTLTEYGKIVSIIIDTTNITQEKRIVSFIKNFAEIKPRNINIIFDITSKELQKYSDLMEQTAYHFSKNKIQLYIKNEDIHSAPYILGKAGPYTFSEEDWANYKEELKNNITNIICSQSTISVDVKEFMNFSKSSFEFRELILNIAKSLLYANSIQRSRSRDYFKYLININKPNTHNLFAYSRCYIRFWNYGWKEQNIDPDVLIELIKSTKETIDEFTKSEETIYKACGMPTRFKICFSCAFKDTNKEEFSAERFKKLRIKKLDDYYRRDIKETIFAKEKIINIFDGGDRLRIYRSKPEPKEAISEMGIVMNTFKIPLFCYDFGEIKGSDQLLTTFFEND